MPYYPLLVGVYPVVGLIGSNITEMYLSAGYRSALVTLLFVLVVYLVFRWLIKDRYKSALICTWFFIAFFTYGHVYQLVEGYSISGLLLGRHRFLFPLWLIISISAGWLLSRVKWNYHKLTRIAGIVSIFLLVVPIIQIGFFELKRYQSNNQAEGSREPGSATGTQEDASSKLPDIYYIILDGYPRQDMLDKYYNYKNDDFVEQLEEIGFYVAPCSQSNYAMTLLSLSSSLNMGYLEDLNPDITQIDYPDLLIHSQARNLLEDLGYQTVSIESGIWYTEFQDADYFLTQDKPAARSFFDFSKLGEFEIMYIRTTIMRLAEEYGSVWIDSLFYNPRQDSYNRILFEFDTLDESAAIPGPKFVFAHILAPHSSGTIFGEDGSFIVAQDDEVALGNELTYLNQRTLEVVQNILATSGIPPVIVIQGDHGLSTESRMSILAAMYFPGAGQDHLYPNITPVNIFRVIFNIYFDQNYPLIPDKSYYSPYEDMFNFQEVAYPCNP